MTQKSQKRIDDSMDEQAVRVLRQFRLVFNTVKRHFQQVEKHAGVGGAQLWALSIVRDHPGIGATQLARRMDVHQSTASNLVRLLSQRALVTSSRDEQDRRAVRLRVSEAGARVLRRAPGPLSGVLPDALGSLDPRTLNSLERALASLIPLLNANQRAGNIPLGD